MDNLWEMDEACEKHAKKLIESVDFYCALYQANQEILKQEKLKKAGPQGVFYDYELKSRIEKSLSKNKKKSMQT